MTSVSRNIMVGVVQMARAPDCGSGNRGFEPHHSPQIIYTINYLTNPGVYDIIVVVKAQRPLATELHRRQTAAPVFCKQWVVTVNTTNRSGESVLPFTDYLNAWYPAPPYPEPHGVNRGSSQKICLSAMCAEKVPGCAMLMFRAFCSSL